MTARDFDEFKKYVPLHSHASFDFVATNDSFLKWAGSAGKHHSWDGGLAMHTHEVIKIALDMTRTIKLDKGILVLASLWHDVGKTYSYIRCPNGTWLDSPLKSKLGGHLARSYSEYMASSGPAVPSEFREEVGHCILAHHGCLEWGSPAMPQTREAWVLHLADSASARCLGGEKLSS